MENLNEKLSPGIEDTDFDDDDDFDRYVQFSDVENICDSKNMIKSLQSTNYQVGVSPLCRKESLRHESISDLNSKLIKMPKKRTSYDQSLRRKCRQMHTLSEEKVASNSGKNLCDESDSEDFCNPITKRKKAKTHSVPIFSNTDFVQKSFLKNPVKTCLKNFKASSSEIPQQDASKSQSDSMIISSQETSGSQNTIASSQESSSCKMITSSSEMLTSENMITSSSEMLTSEKMITSSPEMLSSEKMITSSQENATMPKLTSSPEIFESQNIPSSQESCRSPKMITSSQESLGNQVMNISIQEDSSTTNTTGSQLNSGTEIIATQAKNNSNIQKNLICKEAKFSRILNQSINSNKLKVCSQQSLVNHSVSSKITKIDSADRNKLTESFGSFSNDYLCNKMYRRHNKTEKKIIWSIRKRELEVTKRENAVENREKELDVREADILKREEILKARERRYLRCKTNMKKWMQQLTNNSKLLKKMGVLADETNAFSKLRTLKALK